MAKDRVSPTAALTIVDGKILQEIPKKQLKGRKEALKKNIDELSDQINELQLRKASLQQDVDDLNTMLAQLPE